MQKEKGETVQFECPWCHEELDEQWICGKLGVLNEARVMCPHCGKPLELYEEEESGEIAVTKFWEERMMNWECTEESCKDACCESALDDLTSSIWLDCRRAFERLDAEGQVEVVNALVFAVTEATLAQEKNELDRIEKVVRECCKDSR